MEAERAFARKLGPSFAVAFSADGDLLATVGRAVNVWRTSTGSRLARSHPIPHPSSVCFCPSRDLLAVKNTAGLVEVVTHSGDRLFRVANGEDGEGPPIAYSGCGNYLVDASWSGRLLVRQAESGRIEFEAWFPGAMLNQVHHTTDRSRWAIRHSPRATTETDPPDNDYLTLWNWPFTRGDGEKRRLPWPFVGATALSPDGTALAVVHGAPPDSICVVSIDDPAAILAAAPMQFPGSGLALAWSPDGAHLAVVEEGGVLIRDSRTLERIFELPLEYPSAVAFAPDRGVLAAGSWTNGVLVDWP